MPLFRCGRQPKGDRMNVGELIEELSKLDKSYQVVLSEDAEGNGFHNVGVLIKDSDRKTIDIYPTHYRVGED